MLRKQGRDPRGLTIIDRTFDIPFEQERMIIWLKEYIDYSRADLMAMDVLKFYRLVRVAEKKQQAKEKQHRAGKGVKTRQRG